jgi:hypothetical protein
MISYLDTTLKKTAFLVPKYEKPRIDTRFLIEPDRLYGSRLTPVLSEVPTPRAWLWLAFRLAARGCSVRSTARFRRGGL